MDTCVAGQFRVKSCGKNFSLSYEHRVLLAFGEHLDSSSGTLYSRRAYEDHLQRWSIKLCWTSHDRTVDLTTICISLNINTQDTQPFLRWIPNFLRQEYGSGAGAESRLLRNTIAESG